MNALAVQAKLLEATGAQPAADPGHPEFQYLALPRDILDTGVVRDDRFLHRA